MANRDKIIKHLKYRNDKLMEQYRLKDIRCSYLEHRVVKLENSIKKLSSILERGENNV